MNGVWRGVYAYDKPAQQDEVTFTITVTEHAGATFSGTVQDGAGGHEMAGTVSGHIADDGSIRFLKTMPSTLYQLPNGAHEYVHGKRQKIEYVGRSDGDQSFSGTWTVRGGLRLYNRRLYVTFTSRGTWRMTGGT